MDIEVSINTSRSSDRFPRYSIYLLFAVIFRGPSPAIECGVDSSVTELDDGHYPAGPRELSELVTSPT